ncbi:MAG: sensor histidine kinase [Solirubrobacteraceae bacterium]
MRQHGHVLDPLTSEGTGKSTPSTGERATAALFDGREHFTAYVAHELRTPLATQRALLELALADPDTDVITWREIGEDVLGACKQQERLLEACLTLARSRGRTQQCEPVSLAAITAEALQAHDLGGLESAIALEPAWTIGDPSLVERLVANLITNAIRHNRAGGWIAITTRTERRRAIVTIENTGPRISATELARLFEPFQQRSSPNADSSTGYGLGLAIVNTVASAHHARITARARPGGGLTVEVAFPLATCRSTALL